MTKTKKVFVSGCFDHLHSGHVAFFEEASKLGDLYVGLGADKTVFNLKNRRTVYSEQERLYIVQSLKFVKKAWVNTGSGILDFEDDVIELKPDILFVNEDGASESKKVFCEKYNIEYFISKRVPKDDLPERSTTEIRSSNKIPFRLDLAGGWLDQPYVSKYYPGSVLTISIEPTIKFNDRSGMSSSTRRKAIELWQFKIPEDEDNEKLAKILFRYENPPGKNEVSGSQDSIGIVYPGLNKIHYNNDYWPDNIDSVNNHKTLDWLEKHIYFLPLSPRTSEFDVLSDVNITEDNVRELSSASDNAWEAINELNIVKFGKSLTNSFNAQVKMFPNMITEETSKAIESVKDKVFGWKISGAGGGGYLILISDKDIEGTFKVKIRR